MPPPVVIPDCFRVTLNWNRFVGVAPKNVFHVTSASSDAGDVGAAVLSVLQTGSQLPEMWGPMSSSQHLDNIEVLALDGSTATVITPITGAAVTGGSSGDVMPAVAALVSFRTFQRGPQGRGRMYVGPITEPNNSGGILDPTVVTSMQTAWNLFPGLLAAAVPDMVFVVATYAHADVNEIESIVVEADLATQRRRQDQVRNI